MASRLPWRVWYDDDPNAAEQRHWLDLLAAVPAGALLLFDLGYTNFSMFAQLTRAQVTWVTRAKKNLAYTVERVLAHSSTVRETLVAIGSGEASQTVRLIELYFQGTWHRYLTNELDPLRLPAAYAVALYRQRWRIEDAFLIVKRLLGLAYFWGGAQDTPWSCNCGLPGCSTQCWWTSLTAWPRRWSNHLTPFPWRWSFAACITQPTPVITTRRPTS